jgi:hypothetical protein
VLFSVLAHVARFELNSILMTENSFRRIDSFDPFEGDIQFVTTAKYKNINTITIVRHVTGMVRIT